MDQCHFWIARFRDRQQMESYFEEVEREELEDPMNRFAADQGKAFYDHDFLFAELNEIEDLQAILQGAHVPEQTQQIILELAEKQDFTCNALIVADEEEFRNPVSVRGDSYRLAYVGCHPLRASGAS